MTHAAIPVLAGKGMENGRNSVSAKPKELSTEQIHLRVSPSMYKRWQGAAKRQGMSFAEWARLRLDQASEDGSAAPIGVAEVPHAYANDPVRTALDVIRLNPGIEPDHVLASIRFTGLAVPHSWRPQRFWKALVNTGLVKRFATKRTKLTVKGWRRLMGFG